jgi:outer membrane protein assembly factor BamB
MKTRTLIFILFLCLFGIYVVVGNADDFEWPRWRGPNGDGISMETDWDPEALAEGPKVQWKGDIGAGYSNVAIKENRLYTIGGGQTSKENVVYCLNADNGEVIWQYIFETSQSIEWPQSTPTIDDKYVYALNKEGLLLCLKAKNGKVRWKKDLVSEYDVVKPHYGFAASPVIEGEFVIITANTSGIALNKKTGKKVWGSDKPPEKLGLSASTGPHYATPVLYDYEEKRYAVISSYIGLHAVEVETGKVFWLYEWEPLREVQTTDPLIFDKYVFITQYDEKYGSALLEIGGGEPKVLWESLNMESNVSSPVMIDGYIYGSEGGPYPHRGSLQCLDAKTGDLMWEDKLNGEPISLMAADGKLIILDEDGTLYIAEATPSSYKEISSGDVLEGENKSRKFHTPPVLYKGKIYVRSLAGDLVCIYVSK